MPIGKVLQNNREWAARMKQEKPDFFSSLADQQAPEYFWIGCSDSRVPANQILGLRPGEVFVQRNVGNLATHKDMNCMTCLEYAVNALKVKSVIVCGHYNCGAVKASITLSGKTQGLANLWVSDIKDTRNKHAEELGKLSPDDQVTRLCELNVIRQVYNICSSPTVQAAWDAGKPLSIHGLAYSLKDGLLKELTKPITGYGSLVKTNPETTVTQLTNKMLELTKPITGYGSLAKANPDFPTDSEDAKWDDQSLQKDITDHVKATMFFEQRQKDATASAKH